MESRDNTRDSCQRFYFFKKIFTCKYSTHMIKSTDYDNSIEKLPLNKIYNLNVFIVNKCKKYHKLANY